MRAIHESPVWGGWVPFICACATGGWYLSLRHASRATSLNQREALCGRFTNRPYGGAYHLFVRVPRVHTTLRSAYLTHFTAI